MKKINAFMGTFLPFLLFSLSLPLQALVPGEKVPEFSARNQHGKTISLSDFKGKYVLVYFYPKDDTPGCTREALLFRDHMEKFKKMNAVVLGVSRQDEKSHLDFHSKFKLPFDLLVDTEGSLEKSLGVSSIPGLELSQRQSILIDPEGKVLKFFEKVDPDKHALDVLNTLSSFKAP